MADLSQEEPFGLEDADVIRVEGKRDRPLLTLSSLGFALYWVWLWAMYRSPILSLQEGIPAHVAVYGRFTALVGMVILLLMVAFASKKWTVTKALLWITPTCGTIGFILIAPVGPPFLFLQSSVVQYLGWALAGIAAGACSFLWAAFLASIETNSRRLNEIIMSALIASLIFITLSYMQDPFPAVVLVLVPLGTVLAFLQYRSCLGVIRIERSAMPPKAQGTVLKIYGSLFIFGAAFGTMLAMNLSGTNIDTNRIAFLIVAIIAVLALVYFAVKQRENYVFVYKMAAPIMTIGFLLLPFALGNNGMIAGVVVSAGWRVFELLMWVILFDLIERYGMITLSAFGYGRFATVFGILTGWSLLSIIMVSGEVDASTILVLSSTIAIVLILTNMIGLDFRSFFEAELFYGIRNPSASSLGPDETNACMSLKERCERLSEKYALTPRETEVLELLVRGRNARYIEETLVVSNSTAKAHRYNIYRKLNIHSHQELLDLVENWTDARQ